MGGYEVVADGLNGGVDEQGGAEEVEEAGLAAEGVDEADGGDGEEGDVLEVGYHVEQANEYAHRYGQRQADDGEADAVEDHCAEGNFALAAEVAVHAGGNVANEGHAAAAVGGGDDEFEAADDLGVVDEDENDVDQRQGPAEGVEDGAERLAEQRAAAGDDVGEVVAVEEPAQGVGVGVGVDEVDDGAIGRREFGLAGGEGVDYGGELGEFAGNAGKEEVDDAGDQGGDFGQGGERRQGAAARVEQPPVEVNERLEQVGDEACGKEGEQGVAEVVEGVDQGCGDGEPDDQAHNAVGGPVVHFSRN